MPRHERNVVILGKVGTGKKTLGNHIVGKNIFNRSYHESAFATRNAKSYYAEFTTEHVVYRILTIDTESLQTSYNDPISHIKKEFGNIHLIVFVAAHGRYTDESHGSLIRVVQSLNQQAKSICALVVTGCHGMTDAQRLTVITEFKHDRRSSQVADFMGKGIYAAGFQDTSALPPEVQDVMQKGITRDEQAIRQLVDKCENTLRVEDLPGNQQRNRPLAVKPIMSRRSANKPPNQSTPTYDERSTYMPLDSLQHVHHEPLKCDPLLDQEFVTIERQSKEERTVLILGKVGSGKKTLKNRLLLKNASDGTTKDVDSSYGYFTKGDTSYHIKIFDSERLHSIMQQVHTIHLIVFVISQSRYTNESHDSLMRVVKCLDTRAKSISALVFTHCEGMTDERRQDIVAKFKTNDRTSDMAEFMRKGIHTVGFPDTSSLPAELKQIFETQIAKDTEKICELVEKTDNGIPVKDLVVVQPHARPSAATRLTKDSCRPS